MSEETPEEVTVPEEGSPSQDIASTVDIGSEAETAPPVVLVIKHGKKDKITGDSLGTGRRKSSVARVRVRAGNGKIIVNKRPLEVHFVNMQDQRLVTDTLDISNHRSDVDVVIRVSGGGTTGQAGACRMGLARALVSYDNETFLALRGGGFLTRDSRMKERKKYGLRGARRGVQFSKR